MKFLKNLFVAAFFLVGLSLVTKAADWYTVTVTTIPTVGSANYDLVTSSFGAHLGTGMYVRKLIIANAGATAQDVTVYDTCTSSSAASISLVYSAPAAIGTYVVDFVGESYKLTSPCIIKSSASSVVKATVIYQ